MAERSKENATDLLLFGRELRYFITMVKLKCFCCIQRFWTEKTNIVIIRFKSSSVVLAPWLAWNEFGINLTTILHSFLAILLFSAVHWAQMRHLFPPWPLHKAPGGPCASLWRVCLWSLPCYLTKLLSRYSPQSLIHTTCSAVLVQNWHRVINVVLLMSSGKTGRGWCCRKTESFPGFAAVIQSESASLLVFAVLI